MPDFPRSPCPIAVTLDVLGDRWSLVVVRDLLVGKTRYGDFLASPERIPTNLLTDRLRRLEAQGIVVRDTEGGRRPTYRLTDKGRALLPVLQAMARWATTWVPDTWQPSASFYERRI
jgi:DNA-binding HxlR family transcriptional regulator